MIGGVVRELTVSERVCDLRQVGFGPHRAAVVSFLAARRRSVVLYLGAKEMGRHHPS